MAVGAVPEEDRVSLTGCTAVFCDPDNYPSHERIAALALEGIAVAVGVHPKNRTLSEEKYLSFVRAFSDVNVGALGEIGLDWTVHRSRWLDQERQFTRILNLANSKDVVVVLHLRGMKENPLARELYLRSLTIVEEVMNRNRQQTFHLHCFTGPSDVVAAWLQQFPNTYFGVTNLVSSLDQASHEGLRAIPANRLLLESDAPYFPPTRSYRANAPHLLGYTASAVAGIRGVSCEDILTATSENASRIYVGNVPLS
ncbi:MAG: TatD family hydrolase [Candidatus Thiodiazotropha sp.]